MTELQIKAKEKAEELLLKFQQEIDEDSMDDMYTIYANAKKCAKIAVNEIIESEPLEPSSVDWDDCGGTHQYWYAEMREKAIEFWKEVLNQIEQL